MTEAAVWRFEAIGTHWTISSPEQLSSGVVTRITERIETYDRTYSRFRSDSLVSELARCGGSVEFPDDGPPLLDLYSRLEKPYLPHATMQPSKRSSNGCIWFQGL